MKKYTIFKFEELGNKFKSFEELVSSEYFLEFGFDDEIAQTDNIDTIKNFSCVFRKHNDKEYWACLYFIADTETLEIVKFAPFE